VRAERVAGCAEAAYVSVRGVYERPRRREPAAQTCQRVRHGATWYPHPRTVHEGMHPQPTPTHPPPAIWKAPCGRIGAVWAGAMRSPAAVRFSTTRPRRAHGGPPRFRLNASARGVNLGWRPRRDGARAPRGCDSTHTCALARTHRIDTHAAPTAEPPTRRRWGGGLTWSARGVCSVGSTVRESPPAAASPHPARSCAVLTRA
jgi:hypothetical protein